AHLIASFALLPADPFAPLLAGLIRGRAGRRSSGGRGTWSTLRGFRLPFGFLVAALGHHDHQQQQEDRGGEGSDEPTGVVGDVVADVRNEHRVILAKDYVWSTDRTKVWAPAFMLSASDFLSRVRLRCAHRGRRSRAGGRVPPCPAQAPARPSPGDL